MSLRAKFNVAMAVALAIGLGLALTFANTLSQNLARRRTLAEATLMMTTAEAAMDYARAQVSPLLADLSKTQFLPQSVPFYAARQTLQKLSAAMPDYTFRQPATNPTNPADRPTAREARIIDTLTAQPQLQSLVTEHDAADGSVLSYAKPIRVNEESCLACHSTPEAAPAAMIDVYGRDNGFGWKLHSLVGATIVSVPQAVAQEEARRTLLLIMAGIGAAFLVVAALVNVVLHVSIIVPVGRVSRLADEVSLGGSGVPELDASGKDEIASLTRSFNRMRRSLSTALRLLDKQA